MDESRKTPARACAANRAETPRAVTAPRALRREGLGQMPRLRFNMRRDPLWPKPRAERGCGRGRHDRMAVVHEAKPHGVTSLSPEFLGAPMAPPRAPAARRLAWWRARPRSSARRPRRGCRRGLAAR